MNIERRKIFGYLIIGVALGLLVGMVSGISAAPFRNFVRALTAGNTTPASTSLYEPAENYEQAVEVAVQKASPAVVSITISQNVPIIENCQSSPFSDLPPEIQQFFGQNTTRSCQHGSQLQEVGGGSGFIVSPDGLILTNKHVVSGANASYTVFTNDGKKYSAKVVARDPLQDLAVLKIDATNLSTVTLGNSEELKLGQSAVAIGNALGEFKNTVSVGVISGLGRTVTASGDNGLTENLQGLIQTDAAINPGNSGGPLLDLRGNVVAINTAVASNAQNIGFAIPINVAKRDIASVQANGKIEVPFLGVRYQMVDVDIASKEKLATSTGAWVTGDSSNPAVTKGSPADQAGLKDGDIIMAVNGQPVDAEHPLSTLLLQFKAGDKITLTVNRNGTVLTIPATLTQRSS